jgi:hypothetical protein
LLTIHLATRNLGGRPGQAPVPEYDEDLDDVRTLLIDACALLVERGSLELHIAGFGQSIWPVTAGEDLPALLAQLPTIIWSMGRQEQFEIELYSERVQRTLQFIPEGASVTVNCRSETGWEPEPDHTTLSQSACFGMLNDVRQGFIGAVKSALPHHAAHPWFRAWIHATSLTAATRPPVHEPSVSGFGIDLDDLDFEDAPDSMAPDSLPSFSATPKAPPAPHAFALEVTADAARMVIRDAPGGTSHTVRLSMLLGGYAGPEITVEFDGSNKPIAIVVARD